MNERYAETAGCAAAGTDVVGVGFAPLVPDDSAVDGALSLVDEVGEIDGDGVPVGPALPPEVQAASEVTSASASMAVAMDLRVKAPPPRYCRIPDRMVRGRSAAHFAPRRVLVTVAFALLSRRRTR